MHFTKIPVLLGAVAALGLVPASHAQEPQYQARTYTVRFPGGSLAAFADAIRAAATDPKVWQDPHPVNIVLPEAAARVAVPAIELTGVSPRDALRAVGQILQPEVRLDVETYMTGGDEVLAIALLPERRSQPAQEPVVRVLSLASVVAVSGVPDNGVNLTAETVLTAIETAMSLAGSEDTQFRYHEDSRLLFVRGLPVQVQVVEEVLGQLERDVQVLRARATQAHGGNRSTATGSASGNANPPVQRSR